MDVKTAATDNTQEPSGFPGYVFSGDRDLCISLIPSAQNLLHQVRSFIANSGTMVYGLTREVQGGLIRVTSNAGIEKIEITANSVKKEETFSVDGVEILSGVVKGGKIVTITPPVMGEPEFETLRSYKPTAQAYKYPLKKRPGNYPQTVILPGTTFEDQPRLAVEAYAPVFDVEGMQISDGNTVIVFSGNYLHASAQVSSAIIIADELSAKVTASGNSRTFQKTVGSANGYFYVFCEYVEDYGAIMSSVYIFGEGDPTATGVRERYTNVFLSDLEATSSATSRRVYKQEIAPLYTGTVSQYSEVISSRYSGMMAKAVQAILGYGKLKSLKASDENRINGVKVKYDWRFGRSHGIVKASDNKLWLVEISVHNGVIAMPFPVFKNTKKGTPLYSALAASKQDVLRETVLLFQGLPSGGSFPANIVPDGSPPGTESLLEQAISSGDVIRLSTPTEMYDFYSNSSHSSGVGWAFNLGASGTEAHNTCYSYGGSGGPTKPIVNGLHYKLAIAIGATVSNRAPNQPITTGSASLSLVSSSRLVSSMSFADDIVLYAQSIKSPADTTVGNTDVYTEKAALLVCNISDEVHKVWTEHHPVGTTVISETLPTAEHDGFYNAFSIPNVDYLLYVDDIGVQVSAYSDTRSEVANMIKSDACEEYTGVSRTTSRSGSFVANFFPGYPNMYGYGYGYASSAVGNSTENHYVTDQPVFWSSGLRDGYLASVPYTMLRTLEGSGGYYETPTSEITDSKNKQPNYKIISPYSAPVLCDDITFPYELETLDKVLDHRVTNIKFSVHGAEVVAVFDDYAKDRRNNRIIGDAGPTSIISNKTICLGDILQPESNTETLNYSFIGYI